MSRTTLFSRKSFEKLAAAFIVGLTSLGLTGCTSLLSPINAVPAHRVPAAFLVQPRANQVPIDLARLRQSPPAEHALGEGDILGVYIESILGEENGAPPVHFPDENSDRPPAIGYPVPVREDGTIALPSIAPLTVKGLTLTQTHDLIRRAYLETQFLKEGQDRIIVTLMRERTVRVLVVRQDGSGQGAGGGGGGATGISSRTDFSMQSRVLDMPIYKNDVLHALTETGGLPGVNARNEIKIMRGNQKSFNERDKEVYEYYRKWMENCDPCSCPPPMPEDASIIRIPLRLPPGQIPQIKQEDIILNDGDILYVESRDTEVFYTGGMLGGGQHPLPRDYDLDVLAAISVVGGNLSQGGAGGGAGMGGIGVNSVGGVPPGELIILRKTPCNGQIAISVDLTRAINDPRSRPLVAPGDTLILRFRPQEEILNFGLGSFFTFGIRELFRN